MGNFNNKISVFFVILFFVIKVDAQERDTLSFKKFKELSDLFYKNEKDSLFALKIANVYLKKAKYHKDTIKIADGYYFLSSVYENNKNLFLTYNDSIISLKKHIRTKFYPVIGYFNKGDYFYEKRLLKKSLENYLQAEKYAFKDEVFYYDIKHRIGLLKSRFGKETEALNLFKETYNYHLKNNYQKTNINYHLPIVFALTDSYLRNKKIDSAFYYCKIGINLSKKSKSQAFENYFKFENGLIEFGNKNYRKAIKNISKSLPLIIKNKDLANVSYANFYLGKSLQRIGQDEMSIKYFKKVDSIYQITFDIHPDLRDGYVSLIDYFKKKQDLKNELIYIRKLLEVDKKFKNNYDSTNIFLVENYDTPKLLSKRDEVIMNLQKKSENTKIKLILLSSSLICISIFSVFHFRRRKTYKKKFEAIFKEEKEEKESKINIPQNIVDEILNNLKVFEKEKNFLNKKLTLNSLAKEINTNTSYLSKVINFHKGKSFSNYINELRISYLIKELKTNELYKMYTIRALSEEVGFRNTESFSKSFYNFKGIKPSYFIKELNKREKR